MRAGGVSNVQSHHTVVEDFSITACPQAYYLLLLICFDTGKDSLCTFNCDVWHNNKNLESYFHVNRQISSNKTKMRMVSS